MLGSSTARDLAWRPRVYRSGGPSKSIRFSELVQSHIVAFLLKMGWGILGRIVCGGRVRRPNFSCRCGLPSLIRRHDR